MSLVQIGREHAPLRNLVLVKIDVIQVAKPLRRLRAFQRTAKYRDDALAAPVSFLDLPGADFRRRRFR
jgi:hypothetical protein